MSFLDLSERVFLVFGVANKKSVAWAVGRNLEAEGARVIYSVRSEARKTGLSRLMGEERQMEVCDVEFPEQIQELAARLREQGVALDGFVHSIAFANYSEGFLPFHETRRDDFLQATAVSAFSVVEMARALKPLLKPDASVVAIGISSQVMAENYGYMSPIKAALDSCMRFLAKSFSADSRIRFNTVNAGPLKTSASAGIPGYLESYLYAEKMTLRKEALKTAEVADAATFLLSPRASGINAQGLVVNAGMDLNYFDKEIIRLTMRPETGEPTDRPKP